VLDPVRGLVVAHGDSGGGESVEDGLIGRVFIGGVVVDHDPHLDAAPMRVDELVPERCVEHEPEGDVDLHRLGVHEVPQDLPAILKAGVAQLLARQLALSHRRESGEKGERESEKKSERDPEAHGRTFRRDGMGKCATG
jgi:hypothetical protein